MHARMKGGSTIEWVADSNPDKPLDQSSTDMLDSTAPDRGADPGRLSAVLGSVHGGLGGSRFREGLEITHTPTVHTIHAKQGGTELTEIFSNDLVLEQFNVDMNGTSIKFSPTYKPTPQGLLVNAFEAHIVPAGAPPSRRRR